MNAGRFVKPIAIFALVVVGGYVYRAAWMSSIHTAENTESASSSNKDVRQSEKIIVGDQAQKNLKLTAKPLRADVFWKTITVQGMVVDRPGVSDREVVAPATGIIHQIWHVPGDNVRPGDTLFTLKLSSESLHQAQTELYKATQNIKLAQAKRERLESAGAAIPEARLIEVDNEIKRSEVAVESSRNELMNRGFTSGDVGLIAEGKFIREIPVVAPAQLSRLSTTDSTEGKSDTPPPTAPASNYEVQKLDVAPGQQVQAGAPLCQLSNHQLLAIEGRAFRDETLVLERSIKEGWPVEVDFQESAEADWPPVDQTFLIQHVANTIDPLTRTFVFLMPLENQSKAIVRDGKTQLLWRFRPGQKVRLDVRTEKLENVFVLPIDAVVREGADAFVFTQNVNTFERKPVHVLHKDRDDVVIANDGSFPTYAKNNERWTIPAVVRNAAPQLNRMLKAGGSSEVPKGYHIHADGSLHKNEDEAK